VKNTESYPFINATPVLMFRDQHYMERIWSTTLGSCKRVMTCCIHRDKQMISSRNIRNKDQVDLSERFECSDGISFMKTGYEPTYLPFIVVYSQMLSVFTILYDSNSI
jgi:hypothetical protein